MEYLQKFRIYLLSLTPAPSAVTVKNYCLDVKHFISWSEQKNHAPFDPSKVTQDEIEKFRQDENGHLSARSLDRHVSSLRKFFHSLKLQGVLSTSPFENTVSTQLPTDPYKLKQFKDFLYVYNASNLTIKNYIIDVKQFFKWAEEKIQAQTDQESEEITPLSYLSNDLLATYRDELFSGNVFSASSINRKLSSLRKYIGWAKSQNFLENELDSRNNPNEVANIASAHTSSVLEVNQNKAESEKRKELETKKEANGKNLDALPLTLNAGYSPFPPLRLAQKISKGFNYGLDVAIIAPLAKLVLQGTKVLWTLQGKPLFVAAKKSLRLASPVKNISKFAVQAGEVSTANFSWYQKIWHHAQNTRPNWYRRYHQLPVAHYFNWAILMIVMTIIGVGFYNSFIAKPQNSKPLLAAAQPNRILSFQGRLTDSSNNPITTSSNLRFAIYTDATSTGSAQLWQELDNVTPDANGVFSVLLGKNSSIQQSLFANNANLYLGITVEQTPELTPRQQLATVAYATNAETLQGLPPITQSGAGTSNVVLALNSSGNLSIGAASTFQTVGGAFTLAGDTLVLNTNPGTNGNITITPDGLGFIDLQKPLVNTTQNNNIPSASGSVEIDDTLAILATSDAVPAQTINQDGAGALFTASAGGISKFTIGNSGTITASNYNTAGGVFYADGTGLFLQTTAGAIGQCLTSNGSSGPSWTACSGGSANNFWTITNGALYPVNTTLDVLFGGTASNGANFAFINNAPGSGTPTASVSGNITLNSAGLIQTTNNQQLTIGGDTTGNIVLKPLNGAGTVTLSGYATGIIHSTSGVLSSSAVDLASGDVTGVLPLANGGTNNSLVADNGGIVYSDATRLQVLAHAGSAGLCLTSGGAGAPSWASCSGSNSNFWNVNNGVIYPSNSTLDFILGGDGATTSAKFAVLNMTGSGTPVASVSSGLNGNATYIAADGTLQTTRNHALTIGGSTTGNIILSPLNSLGYVQLNGTVNSNLVPTITDTYNLGSPSNEWNNLYVKNLVVSGSIAGFWQRNSGVLSPTNITDDLAIGGIATNTARFQVFANTGNATTAGNLTFTGNGSQIQTTSNQTLTLGGNTTGGIVLSPSNGTGTIGLNASNITTNQTTVNLLNTTATTVNFAGAATTVSIGNSGGSTTINGGLVVNADTQLLGNTTLGDSSSDTIAFIGQVNTNILPSTTNARDLGSLAQQWNNIYGNHIFSNGVELSQFFQRNFGVISPLNITDDLAVGGTATNTAKFQVSGLTGNATTTGTLTFDGTGNLIQTTKFQDLTIGGTTTGNITLSPKNGTGTVTIAGLSSGVVHSTGGILSSSNVNLTSEVTGILPIANGGTNTNTIGSAGSIAYSTGTAYAFNSVGSTGQCLVSNGSGAPNWTSCTTAAGATNYWTLDGGNGILYPVNTTLDVLFGGTSSNSANFAFLNNAPGSGTPTASISGNLTLNSAGNIQTTNNQPLTIGGNTTGSVTLAPSNGNGTLNLNATNINTNQTSVNLLNTTATTINFGGAATSINIGNAGGSATFNGGLVVNADTTLNGNTTLGDSSSDRVTFNGLVNSNIIPSANNTYDLGSITNAWNNIFVNNIISSGNISGLWQRFLGVLSPVNIGDDLAIGGTATGTAKFQVFGNTGNATTAGNLTFNGNGVIQATNNQPLTIGGDTTGSITVAPNNGTGTVNLNATNINTNQTSVNLLNSTTTAINFGGAATALSIGAGSGTTTVNNGLTVTGTSTLNGNVVLGANSTKTITANGQFNSSLIPSVTDTYDLGSIALEWNNLYVKNIIAGGNVSGFWQRFLGVISPTNITDDLAIGGTATNTARFQVFGNTGNATTTGTLTFDGTGSLIQTTRNQGLTIGGDTTGNITIKPLNGTGTVTIAGLGTGVVHSTNGLLSSSAVNLANGSADITGTLSTSNGGTGQNSYAGGDLLYYASGTSLSKLTIGGANTILTSTGTAPQWSSSLTLGGNLNVNGNTTLGDTAGDTITFNGQVNSNIIPTSSNAFDLGSITNAWNNLYVNNIISSGNISGFWQRNSGALSPANITDDLLAGGTATSTAKFAVLNMAGGTPVASISSGLSGTGLYLSADGSIQTVRNQGLTLGGATTGNIILSPLGGTGTVTINGLGTGIVHSTTGVLSSSAVNLANTDVTGILPLANGGTNANLTADNGGIVYSDASKLQILAHAGTVGQCLVSGGSGAPSWTNCSSASQNWWNVNNGALFPINSTLDLLLGGDGATTSAKFAVLNMTGSGTPTASVSSGLNGNATYITADGTLQTTRNQGLTIGGATTGNITLSPLNGGSVSTINLNARTLATNQTTVDLLNTTATSINFGGAATSLSIGNSGGTTTVNGALAVNGNTNLNGNTTIGDNASDTIAFTAHVNSSILPSTDTTYDLGSGSLRWNNVYAGNLILPVTGGIDGYWTLASSVLSPTNTWNDLVIGGTSTSSAKFQVFSNTGNATTSGNLTFNGNGTIQTTNNQPLTLGGNSTGNIILSPNNAAGSVTVNGFISSNLIPSRNDTYDLGSGTNEWNNLYVKNIISTGNLAGFWQRNSGTLAPLNISDDLLAGGTATSTARFAVLNMSGPGTPTASVSSGLSGTGMYFDANGTIQTVRNQGLTLGGATTGNITLSPLNGSGIVTVNGTSLLSSGTSFNLLTGATTISIGAGSGTTTVNNGLTVTGTSTLNGNVVLGASSSQTIAANGQFTTSLIPNTDASFDLGSSPSNRWRNLFLSGNSTVGGNETVTGTATVGNLVLASTANYGGFWQRFSGALSPVYSTDDILVGSNATTSAKFALLNIANGTPVASISSGFSGTGMYFDATGTIQTVRNAVLTLGGNTTGGVVFGSNVASNILPKFTNTYDLGSLALQWNNGYFNNIYANGQPITQLFQRNSGALSPLNITDDLLLGGTATSTARFAFINNTGTGAPTASISSNFSLVVPTGAAPAETINVLNGGSLNIQHSAGGDTGLTSSLFIDKAGQVGVGTASVSHQLEIAGSSTQFNSTVYLNPSTFGSSKRAGLNLDNWLLAQDIGGTGVKDFVIYDTASGQSKFYITANANGGAGFGLPVLGAVNSLGNSEFVVNQPNTAGDILSASTSGTTKFVITNDGTVGIANNVTDATILNKSALDVRKDSFGNALTLFKQLSSDTNADIITASNSAGLTEYRLTNAGVEQARQFQDLDSTAYFLDPAASGNSLIIAGTAGIGTTSPLASSGLDIEKNALGNAAEVVNQLGNGDIFTASASGVKKFTIQNDGTLVAGKYTTNKGILYINDTAGTIAETGQGAANTVLHGNGTSAPSFSAVDLAADVTGILPLANGGTNNNITADNGGIVYSDATKLRLLASTVTAGQCLLSGSSSAPTWGSCGSGTGVNWWTMSNGALFPLNNTLDLFVGGSATTSAKFAVLNMTGSGTPTASVSSGLSGNATYITADGSLQTARAATLTLGGTTTGNIVLKPQNGGGSITIDGPTLDTTNTTFNAFTTASTLGIGAASGTTTINNGLTVAGNISDNGGTFTTNQTTFNLLNTTATTINFGGAATVALNVGAATTPINLKGNVTLGTDATNTITSNGLYASDLIPTGNGSINLGSATHYYGTVYANNFIAPVSGGVSGFWQLTNSVISPVNAWNDLAIGGNATGSATPWQVFATTVGVNTAGTATSSGNLSFRGTNTNINLLNGSILSVKTSIGGDAGLGTVLTIANNGNLTATGTLNLNSGILATNQTTASLFDATATSINIGSGATSGIGIGNASGINTIRGNVVLNSTSGNTLTINGRVNTDIIPDVTNSHDLGSNDLKWRNIFAGSAVTTNNLYLPVSGGTDGYWSLASNVLSPTNNWNDLAIGGTATSTAKFQVFSNTGNATTAGNLTFNGNGVIQTTNNLPFTLGGNSTGTITLAPSNGGAGSILNLNAANINTNQTSVNLLNTTATTINLGNAATTLNLANNALTTTIGIGGSGGTTTVNNALTVTGATTLNGTINLGNATSDDITATGFFASSLIPKAADTYNLGSVANEWDTLYIRQIVTPSSGGLAGFWQLSNKGVLAPANIGNDVLIGGGIATPSAATDTGFQIFGSGPNQATATTSGNLAFYGSAPTISTQRMVPLTIGNATTGPIQLSPKGTTGLYVAGTGNVGIGTTTPGFNLEIAGITTQYGAALHIDPSTFGSSKRAQLELDNWQVAQDLSGNGTKDFFLYDTVNAATRFYINTIGGTGIGATSNLGNATLIVNQNNTSGLGDIITASASGTTQFKLTNAGIVQAKSFQDLDDTRYFIDPASSGTALSLNGTASMAADLTFTGASTTHNIYTFNNGNLDFQMSPGGAIPTTGVVHSLYLQAATGNVGIATTSPSDTLDIAGNATASGNLSFRGNATTHNLNLLNNGQLNINTSVGGIATLNTALTIAAGNNTTAGNIGINNVSPSRQLDASGSWGGNVTSTQDTTASNHTDTVSSSSLVYFVNYTLSSPGGSFTTTFNITGLPQVEGSFFMVRVRANTNNTQTATASLQANGQSLGSATGSNGASNKDGLYAYIGSQWNLIASNDSNNQNVDLAELFPYGAKRPIPGELLASNVQNHQVQLDRTGKEYDQKAMGIVTTNPNILFGKDSSEAGIQNDNTFPIDGKIGLALAGRVPTIVTNLDGPIDQGDSITTSPLAGVGMKPNKATQTVGKTLDSFNPLDGSTVCTSVASYDSIPWPNDNGTNAAHPCFSVPVASFDQATQQILNSEYHLNQTDSVYVGKVMVLVGNGFVDPDVYLTTTGDIHFTDASASANFTVPHYYSVADAVGLPITRMGRFLELAVGNLRAGSIQTQQLFTNSLAIATSNVTIAGVSLHDYIQNIVTEVLQNNQQTVNSPIASVDQLHAGVISPLGTDNSIALSINNSRLEVKNGASGSAVATIDNQGNASFSGTLNSQNLAVNADATISGTLHAGKIVADDIVGLRAAVGTLSAQNITNVTNIYFATPSAAPTGVNFATGPSGNSSTNSGVLTPIQSGLNPYIGYTNLASYSGFLAYVPNLSADTAMFNQGLVSLGTTSLGDTTVTGQLSIGTNLILADSSVNVLGSSFEIQSLRQGGVNFEGGLIAIDTDGNLMVNGNAVFSKNLAANVISPLSNDRNLTIKLGENSQDSALATSNLAVQNASGSGVFSIDQLGNILASGAATIGKLNLTAAQPALAVSNTEQIATGSAGTAAIKANHTEITIDNKLVTNRSLIYITPVGASSVPYLLRQVTNTSFTVGIPTSQFTDTTFNWLIVN